MLICAFCLICSAGINLSYVSSSISQSTVLVYNIYCRGLFFAHYLKVYPAWSFTVAENMLCSFFLLQTKFTDFALWVRTQLTQMLVGSVLCMFYRYVLIYWRTLSFKKIFCAIASFLCFGLFLSFSLFLYINIHFYVHEKFCRCIIDIFWYIMIIIFP